MTALNVGFFGKVPQLGDFVERGMHPGFLSRWDGWLQEGVATSHAQLGEMWLDVYLTSPAWRFALGPGLCGDGSYVGVVIPSVDRVGRYFPLTVVASLPPGTPALALLVLGRDWFEAVERCMRAQLEREEPGIERFERDVEDLGGTLLAQLPAIGRAPLLDEAPTGGWLLPLPGLDAAPAALLGLVEPLAARGRGPISAWITEGSPRVPALVLLASSLPRPATYAAMIAGTFDPAAWQTLAQAMPAPAPGLAIDAATRSEPGHVRRMNEDAAWSRPEDGMWLVADGMGGYTGGAAASAAVCAEFDRLDWSGSLAERVRRSEEALVRVNAALRPADPAEAADIVSASTVVVLLLDADAWACVWAGDSRLYRLRDGALGQLTRDHSQGHRGARAGEEEYFVTAGIGVEDRAGLESTTGDLRVGDVFMLCTDGLYETLSEPEMAAALALPSSAEAADRLVGKVLAGPATDNLTVAVVAVHAS